MPDVATVSGMVAADRLGHVLMHEHLFIRSLEVEDDYPDLVGWNPTNEVDRAVQRLEEAHAQGVRTIVDLTVMGMGRSISLIEQVAARSPINIVVATGLYTYDELPYLLRFLGPDAVFDYPELMTQMFVRDLTVGIGDSGVRAGLLKCATDEPGMTAGVERTLRAVARAHAETGAPISTHTDPFTRRGLEQQKLFRSEGVDLSRVIIGHSGDTTDLDYLKEMADHGSTLGMDRFGHNESQARFDARADVVADLCAAGYADRVVLSHDASSWIGWLPRRLLAGHPADQSTYDFSHIHRYVLPALTDRGVADEDIRRMLVDNPRRLLGGGI